MPITSALFHNITVFEDVQIPFCPGINILLGENGLGKTHIMKFLYAACKSANPNTSTSFPHKTVMVFRPDGMNIGRLVNRSRDTSNTANIKVFSDSGNLDMTFTNQSRKWDAKVTGERAWERQANLSSVFIPAKDILSNAWNLQSAVTMGNVEFDDTYLDIIAAASVNITRGTDSKERKKYLNLLQAISNGKVTIDNEHFYLKPGNQAKLEFNLVAEGLRKIALLWQLIKNGTLESGSILFWDEPEANINPKHIPTIVDLLLTLQREGVQIFVSTHDYFLSRYFEARKKETDSVLYHSLYRNEEGKVSIEQNPSFKELKNNSILDTFMELYREEIRKAMDE